MTPAKNKNKRGRKSLAQKYQEPIKEIKILVPLSMYEFLMNQPEGASAYLRSILYLTIRIINEDLPKKYNAKLMRQLFEAMRDIRHDLDINDPE